MTDTPLVSVITPTWQRHDLLLSRCIPSVQAQEYLAIEHIVISDGPDPELAGLIDGQVIFDQLPENDPSQRWGVRARRHGQAMSSGEYIAYLDDDNAYRPGHIAGLVAAMEADPDAAWAYSMIQMHGNGAEYIVGAPYPPHLGGIDTTAMFCRRSALESADWRDDGQQQTIDWDLAERWMAAGLRGMLVPQISADYYFR